MTDYSTAAIEDFIQRQLKDHVLLEGMTRTAQDTSDAYACVGYLRGLCSQRDDLLEALEKLAGEMYNIAVYTEDTRCHAVEMRISEIYRLVDPARAAIAKAKGETP